MNSAVFVVGGETSPVEHCPRLRDPADFRAPGMSGTLAAATRVPDIVRFDILDRDDRRACSLDDPVASFRGGERAPCYRIAFVSDSRTLVRGDRGVFACS